MKDAIITLLKKHVVTFFAGVLAGIASLITGCRLTLANLECEVQPKTNDTPASYQPS